LAENTLFPEMIEKLPDVDLALPGVKAKLFQGPGMQAVFFTVEGPKSRHIFTSPSGV
jgi:hypothetical protein